MSCKTFKCEPIVAAKASGPALVSDEAICFYLVEPDTGVLVEQKHVLYGKSLADKMLVAHAGKGSSVVQMDGLFKIARKNKGPAGVVLRNPDPVFVSALLVMEVPSVFNVDEAFYDYTTDGCQVEFNEEGTLITVTKP